MMEGRRVVRKEKRIQADCCLQPAHLLLKHPVSHLIESTASTQNVLPGLISTHRNYTNASISFSLHLKWAPLARQTIYARTTPSTSMIYCCVLIAQIKSNMLSP